MYLTLENQFLQVEITNLGAEPVSILHKESGREYLWNGDPEIWPRRSPMLFPNCGGVRHGGYTMEGERYPAGKHGFARDLNHKVVCAEKKVAAFRLEQNAETLKFYPYKFALKTTYKLENNSLICKEKVINYDDKPIYFSFGFHTGLRCPFVPGTSYADYDLVFEQQEDCKLLEQDDDGLLGRGVQEFRPQSRAIPLQKDSFTKSIILEGVRSQYIQLQERGSGDYIRVSGTDSPYTVIWSAGEGAPAICIEPWYGVGDYQDFDGEFSHKEGVICLEPQTEWSCRQILEIGVSKHR